MPETRALPHGAGSVPLGVERAERIMVALSIANLIQV
ncbi:Uncharacterised protein [Pandoraea pulmonicola]|uniref:Uncharacterized protein n=1 Tax=Pandoraea pulmonicola TaxID=93221 RepID=A0AAJ4Z8V8_PANPU|nr:Uncharacterised protein [Pandoraea pulmonicola]